MTRHVLVPVDGSAAAKQALAFALTKWPDARITAIHVIDPVEASYGGEYVSESVFDAQQEHSEGILKESGETAAEHDREIETVSRTGRPAREIVTYADESGVDHVVMGSHGRTGLSRILLGSVAETVVRRSPTPVTIVR